MLRQEQIASVIDAQRDAFMGQDPGLQRDALPNIPIANGFATIITGIRRCGKSTLLLQLLKQKYSNAIYINFDDIRFSGFETGDFVRLHNEIAARGTNVLFFDEIQQIKEWEKYVNQLLREGFQVFITGSNASMLSKELGTHLTGRHIPMELFPFSYTEFIRFKKMENGEVSLQRYMQVGGIPIYVKYTTFLKGNVLVRPGMSSLLSTLVDDILIRDIAIRHGIRDVASLRQLTTYLITNIGNPVSASKLTGMFDIKAASTFLEYFSYLTDAYLLDFVPQFSHSLKAQARNPKKVYVMDMGLYTQNAISASGNEGRRLENLVYLHLRRSHGNIFYYKGKGECDFVTMEKETVTGAIQVCLNVTDDNFDREYNGVVEAMQELGLSQGVIVTMNQSDSFEKDGLTVRMIPAYKYLSE